MTGGEGGFSGPPKKGDVIYERPLIITIMSFIDITFCTFCSIICFIHTVCRYLIKWYRLMVSYCSVISFRYCLEYFCPSYNSSLSSEEFLDSLDPAVGVRGWVALGLGVLCDMWVRYVGWLVLGQFWGMAEVV